MGDNDTLVTLINNSLDALKTAQDIADRTVRPNNVCAGHDALFALTKAVAQGVSTSLSVSAGRLNETHTVAIVDGKPQNVGAWPQVWQFVNSNARTILAWVGIWGIVIILRGELKTCLDLIPRGNPQSAYTGGAYQEAPYP